MSETASSPKPPLRQLLSEARLYLCCDARERQGDLPEFLDAVLAGGVDVVQLRQKGMEAKHELAALEVFADACRRHGKLLAVNDRADVAAGAAADVLHLGQDDLPVPLARSIIGAEPLIGRSCHAEAEVDEAAGAAGVDYFCTGPVWPTPTKPGRFAPGLSLVAHAARLAPPFADGARPWFAIGGIDKQNLGEVMEAGARRIVVVRALTEADDPGGAAAGLAGLLRG